MSNKIDFTQLISKEQCEFILNQKLNKEFKLLQYTIKPLSDNVEGFMGEHLRLLCEISHGNENSQVQFFIKKQVILSEDISADLISAFNETLAYKKESLFYKIISENPNHKIKCIAKNFPFPMDLSLLILEDLSVDQFISGKDPLFDLDHCKIVLKNLVDLHTYSLKLERKYNFIDIPELIDDTFFSFHNKFGVYYMNASIETTKQAIDCYPDFAENPEIKTLFEQEVKRILTNIVQPSKKFPNVFCHGDLWHNNILFKYEKNQPIDCRFVDFQELRYLPPVHDIQFLLFINTTAEFRQKHLQQLYEFYYEEFYKLLKNNGLNPNEIFSFYDFQECCSEFYPFTKFIAVIYQLCHLTSAEFLTKSFKLKADSVNLYLGTRYQYFIPELKINRDYHDKYREILNEFILNNRNIIREDCFEIMRRKIHSNNYILKKYEVLSHVSKNLLKITILLNEKITEFCFFMKCLNNDVNRKEVFIYQILALNDLLINTTIIDLINQVMPKCYYSVNGKSIVLENLEENGFKHIGTLDYQSVDTVIRTLAKFHAAYLIFEHKSQTEKVHKFYELSDIITELKKIINCNISTDNLINTLQPSNTFKNVLCHGNLALENIMFKNEDRSECRFVDFKQSQLLPPSFDILIFLYKTTSESFRNQYLNQIIDSYYDYLTVELGRSNIIVTQILTFIEFKNSFDEVKSILESNHSLNDLPIE